jgi:glycosyltransferase involved in cell wall biosynthesis
MYTFVRNFVAWLDGRGIEHTRHADDDYDVLFVNSWVVPLKVVARVKRTRPGVRVAHRVDGAAVDYGSDPAGDRVQARVNLYADVTIFQSQYSRFSTREKFPVVANDGPVIYNPVDIAEFTPAGERLELPAGAARVACASWSVNPRKGTWRINELALQHPDVIFVLCGRFDAVGDHANVVRLGHLEPAVMARALRSCDVFLNLSENDPCPNVVLEALASGLPVLFYDSGGVRELVGDCGLAIDVDTFRDGLRELLSRRDRLSSTARARALAHFAPTQIFPKYWEAISASTRRALPTPLTRMRLAIAGYPVLLRVRTPQEIAAAMYRRAPSVVRGLSGRGGLPQHRVGWATYDSFPARKRRFRELDSFTGMRVGNVVNWMADECASVAHELYDPDRRYDVVVFQKVMDGRAQAEADKIRAYGGRVVFDANVNYYEDWGDYFVPATRPTEQQRRDAHNMTQRADWVVADSSYLRSIIEPLNPRVTWIPDNVDTSRYTGVREHGNGGPLRLVWSGVGKKAAHLLEIHDVLAALRDVELVLVSDEPPDAMRVLAPAIPCRFVRFSPRKYLRVLHESDAIISPKRLVNAYEMGHTEYKITLGMAVGLPAVASAQQSYREAIEHRGGGFICQTAGEWREALERLRRPSLRADVGARARQTVHEKYATPVVARQYLALLLKLVRPHVDSAAPVD